MSVATLSPAPAGRMASPMPTDTALKPNPHPYAIKTTSTAILARSNSSGHAVANRHHYVPPASPRPDLERSQSTKSGKSKSEYRGHRYTTSLSSDKPLSFPAGPPSPARSTRSLSEDQAPEPLPLAPPERRSRIRAETLPLVEAVSDAELELASSVSAPVLGVEDLPSNPKLWSPAQLSAYLVTALRVRSADAPVAVAAPVARDIAAWIRAQCISGRAFLRWNEDDLATLGINTFWRTALLNASRNLRQNVLRGRIWGAQDDAGSPDQPIAGSLYSTVSSTSSLDVSDSAPSYCATGARLRRRNAGRVRGLVSRWEHTSSDAGSESGRESPVSPAKSTGSLPPVDGEEPTIEELLASLPENAPVHNPWGARAWEVMEARSTVKRAEERDAIRSANSSGSGDSGFVGSMKRIKAHGSTKVAGEADGKRIVTSLFIGEPEPLTSPEPITSPEPASSPELAERSLEDEKEDERLREIEAALEADVASARQQLVSFSTRLEEIEKRIGVMETDGESDNEKMRKKAADEALKKEIEEAVARARREWEAEHGHEHEQDPTLEDQGIVARRSAISKALLEPYGIRDLPGYIALVGFGMCAVVAKVVLRRIAEGRRA